MTPSLILLWLWASSAAVGGEVPKTPAAEPRTPLTEPRAPGAELRGPGTERRATPATDKQNLLQIPMIFYVGKGSPDSCGPGCSEWIAAEGEFDVDAPERLRDLLAQRRGGLPIYFHSPGGLLDPATSIGRILRQKGITAGVSKTVPEKCRSLDQSACDRLKQSGEPLAAELNAVGSCASACTYALIGATVRQIPPGAKLGVHSSKLVRVDAEGRVLPSETVLTRQETAARNAVLRDYIREMGIDTRLLDLVAQTPHEQMYFLSRDELVRLRIDTRTFVETPWFFMDQSRPFPTKFVSEAKGADRSEFRVSMLQLSCAQSKNSKPLVNVTYYRGLATDEVGTQRQLRFAIGDRSFVFAPGSSARKLEFVDTGSSFDMRSETEPWDIFESLQAGRIEISAIDASGRAASPAVTRLSTQGLASSIAAMREQCADSNRTVIGNDRPLAGNENVHTRNDRPLVGNESGHTGR